MSDHSLFSTRWHQVKSLKPRLAAEVQTIQQRHRGRTSYLLHRPSTRAHHRVGSLAWELIARFDGTRTVDEVWTESHRSHGNSAPSQPEFVTLLSALHEADLLVVDRVLDAERLFQRGQRVAESERRQRLANPLYLRFALHNPDQWLTRFAPYFRAFFTRPAGIVWITFVIAALGCVLPEWNLLTQEIARVDSLTARHVLAFVILYTVMKSVHELAHAVTIKHYGGAVKEVGIALMVLLPNPYTDASAATFFASRSARIHVSAAGIVAEVGLAAIAALVWTVSDGLLHDIALMAMVIGAVSTVLFNANPLLKFDGYYMLADALEIPNLAERSRRRLLQLSGRIFLGLPGDDEFDQHSNTDINERRWLLAYGIGANLYRCVLMTSIAWFLSGEYFIFGVLLALYVVVTILIAPVWRLFVFLKSLPEGQKRRSLLGAGAPALAVLVFMAAIPVPRASMADGVVWLPEHAVLRASLACDVVAVNVEPGTQVKRGQTLLRCEDPELMTQLAALRAETRELRVEKLGLATIDPVRYQGVRNRLQGLSSEMLMLESRLEGQRVYSQITGRFAADTGRALMGRRFEQGDVIAWVIPPEQRTIRVAVTQDQIDRVEQSTARIDVALLQHPGATGRFNSRILKRTPRPDTSVVSAALTDHGGAQLAAKKGGSGIELFKPAFDLELEWPASAPDSRVGGRVRVRFVHEAEPLVHRLVATVQRAIMGRSVGS